MSVYHQFLWTNIKQKDHMFYKHYRIMSSTAMVSPWFCFPSSKRRRRCCLYVNPYQNKWSIAYCLLTKFRQYSWFMVTKNFAFDCSWKYENISKQIILQPKRAYLTRAFLKEHLKEVDIQVFTLNGIPPFGSINSNFFEIC